MWKNRELEKSGIGKIGKVAKLLRNHDAIKKVYKRTRFQWEYEISGVPNGGGTIVPP